MNEFLYKKYSRIVTWIGDIMVATKPPKTTSKQILELMDIIQPGDVLCRKYTYYLDTYLIPGEYSHSGIVMDKNQMVHSIAEGVGYIHPIDFVKDTDGFIILRPKYEDTESINKTISQGKYYVDSKVQYDFLFNDPTKLYCHEMTCACLGMGGILVLQSTFSVGIFPFKFKKTAYLADDIIKVCDVIYKF